VAVSTLLTLPIWDIFVEENTGITMNTFAPSSSNSLTLPTETMSSTEIAKLTGKQKKHVHQDIKDQIFIGLYDLKDGQDFDHEQIQGINVIVDKRGYWSEVHLDREHTLTLITGYDVKARHAINRRWLELESAKQQPVDQMALPMIELQIAETAARMLRMSDTSKIRMLSKLGELKGVDTRFLPAYSDDKLTSALGDLLKQHGVDLSAVRANQILFEMGLLEKLERRSTGKTVKHFWSITAYGLEYGKNETSPQNPNQTQPRWFVDKFEILLSLINSRL